MDNSIQQYAIGELLGFRIIKKFIPDFRQDMQGRIAAVRHEDPNKLHS